MTDEKMIQLAINTIRTLSIDAVQQAKSGHPGTPMALAPLVYTLWNRVMRFDPQDPIWPNRDRRMAQDFVIGIHRLAAGEMEHGPEQHGSVAIGQHKPRGIRGSPLPRTWRPVSWVGPHDRHENVWGLGAAERTPEKVRFRAGQSGDRGEGITRQEIE